ncbi:MAG: phosphotransferase [Planctomycetota bacterium]|nr:phosphotransferase [Planctomycetota bacterium]
MLTNLKTTFLNLKRLRQIVLILARHGFGAVLWKAGLYRLLGIGDRVRVANQKNDAAGAGFAEQLALALEEMGATFIKFGQMLATRADLLPPEFLAGLARLQSKVSPLPFAEIRPMLVAELSGAPEEIFARFDETPLASGSIGQVHAATLKSGEAVIVKIKRPDTDRQMREDLSLLRFLAEIVERNLPEAAALSPAVLVEEFARGLLGELDFVNEAAATEKFATAYARPAGFWSFAPTGARAPQIFWQYTTRNVLVEEKLAGTPLTDATPDARLAAALANCFLDQYFIAGFFHSDPHAGNLLRLPDGAIGFIDFGQVGHLTGETRQNLLALLLALNHGDLDTVADICADLGHGGGDAAAFRQDLSAYLDRYVGAPLKNLNFGALLGEALMMARRHGLTMPRELILLAKSAAIAANVIFKLAPDFRFAKILPAFAKRAARQWLSPRNVLFGGALFSYRLWGLVKHLPGDLRELLTKIAGGQLRIIFRHEGLEELGDQIERASNRITLGLLIAAILLGSSLVLAVAPDFTRQVSLPFFADAPLSAVVAGIGYLSAMGLGFWLAWAILRGKRL